LHRNAPALYGMALLAISPKLPTVNIRVAGSAILSDVVEYETGVALPAGDSDVHTT
jgi:hypothetical protein